MFPERQVGYNNSGHMKISGEGMAMDGDDPDAANANLSDVRDVSRKRRDAGSQFHMEPERWASEREKRVEGKCGIVKRKPKFLT